MLTVLPVGQASACPAPLPPELHPYRRLGDDRAGQAEACPTRNIFDQRERLHRIAICLILLMLPSACGTIFRKSEPDPQSQFQITAAPTVPPDKAPDFLKEVGSNFVYGQGLGETALTAGTVAVFPPFAVWVLGNAALSLGGYEPLRVSDALPEESKEAWVNTFDDVTSGPGRVSAALAGEEFRTKEVAKEKLKQYIVENNGKDRANR